MDEWSDKRGAYAIIVIIEGLFIIFPIARLEFNQWAPREWVGHLIIAGSF
ncbi:hypothetical protein GF325_13585 [Candidatus Bathyarchaeota archaeon]|nr:hypothetical protein [Candidatus Bathyarchaeota archaeon]